MLVLSTLHCTVLLATFSLGMLPARAQTSRIPQAVSSASPRVAIAHTVSPRVLAAADLGDTPADRVLSSVTLRFSMSPDQSASLDTLLAAQQNPASPLYRQWLTPEQFGARFGLSTADLTTTAAWLQSQGLTVTGVARGQSFITVSGNVASLNAAFGISIHTIQLDGEKHVANLTDPTLPSPLANIVGTITGLNDLRLRPHVHPRYTSSITGSHFIAPGDFYTIYDINPLLTGNINGAGIKIAVAGQTDILLSDVAAFRSASGLSANPPTVKLIGSDPGFTSDDQVEASLDVEWSGAVAPGASVLYVNSTDVIDVSLTQIIDQNLAPIATVSYGDCESGFGSSDLTSFNQLFRQAAAQGQTVVGPAGDSGATDCDNQATVASGGLAVDFPASSPYVTGIGGTMFNEAAGTYWSSTNGTFSGSALSYIPEAVWNETGLGNGLSSGGGGASFFFSKPAWQVGSGVPADASRDVPDIAFNAASEHDGYLFCQGGFCTNGYRNASNNLDVVGGTSVGTPAFAGIMALLEQKLQAQVGLANPTIYALATSTFYPSVFHDVATGNNDSPCTIGTADCTTIVDTCDDASNTGKGCIGYSATAGYDLASGWGSLDVFNYVNDWSQVTPLASGSGANASTTTIAPSSATVTQGVTLTLTATIASASSSITTIPTGRAELILDGVDTGSSSALTNGRATLTYNAANLSLGNHIFGVVYSGDVTYQGSQATVTIAVVARSATTTTLSAGPGVVTALQTVTYTATVSGTASGTPTGTVQFVRTSAGGTTIIGAPVALVSGTATLPSTMIPAGNYSITAVYSGDANFDGSTSAASGLTVTSFAVTATLTPTSAAVSSLQPVAFTVTVTPANPDTAVATGGVQFAIDGGTRGQPVPLSGGSATSPGFIFSAGSHTVDAIYIGDSLYSAVGTNTATVTSIITPTTTAFTPLPPASVAANTLVPVTITVSGLSTAVTSTAAVKLLDGAVEIGGFSALTSGTTIVGTTTIQGLSPGTHTLTAVFTGDGTYAASTSAPFTIVAVQGIVNIVPTNPTISQTAGQSTSDIVDFVSAAFTSTEPLTLSCAVTFNGPGTATNIPTCGLNPATINFASGPATRPVTLTILSVAPSTVTAGPQASYRSYNRLSLGGASLASLLLLMNPKRRRNTLGIARFLAAACLLCIFLTTLSGCGGSANSGGSSPPPVVPTKPGTTKGSYTITLNLNDDPNQPSTVSFSGTVALTIQ